MKLLQNLALAIFCMSMPAMAEEGVWVVKPGEAYGPDTYCRWNRSGLPSAQQKICDRWDRSNGGPHQFKWKTITADDGDKTMIDLNSIQKFNTGSVEVIVANEMYAPTKMTRLLFDCHGRYMDEDNGFGVTRVAPPRSVMGGVQSLVCGGRSAASH